MTTPTLASLALLLAATIAGCGMQRRVGPDPVPLGEWCHTVGRTTCNWIIDSCTSGEAEWTAGTYSCEDAYEQACVGSRNRAQSSGRSYDELARCADYVENLSCRELGLTRAFADGRIAVDDSRMPPETAALCGLGAR
jgi:hypothetical protein